MPTNFNYNGTDVDKIYVTKSYLIDRYPELVNTFKMSGLYLWGTGQSGVLGNNTSTNVSSPVQTIASGSNWSQVSCGSEITGSIKTDGRLWMWGSNNNGQLGNLNTTIQSSPVQTSTGGTNWKQVSTNNSTTAAIKTDGTLWTWGLNNYGQLGRNSIINSSSPVQTVSGTAIWKQVSNSGFFMGAIKTDGTLWVWGRNNNGQLGTGNTINRSSPIQTISGGTNWRLISAAGAAPSGTTGIMAAIKTDGTLWGWGENSNSQLGINTTPRSSSPVQTVAGGTNWVSVSAGPTACAGIKSDGTLWLWGRNFNGQLGGSNPSINPESSPVQSISGGTNWKQISMGNGPRAAIKTDGSLWIWGDNQSGAAGAPGFSANISSPIQTIASGYNWTQCSASTLGVASIRDFNMYNM